MRYSIVILVLILVAWPLAAFADDPVYEVLLVEDLETYTLVQITPEMIDENGWAHITDSEGGNIWVTFCDASFDDIPEEFMPDRLDYCTCSGSVYVEGAGWQQCKITKDCGIKRYPCKVLINGETCCYAPC